MQVIATAGHVDHGKSTLVRALTGMEPDRWEQEKRRGLTIDLGYAWLTLPSGERLAFVDVPGHERFVPNMLAGVGPVPAVLFTVAADEGWMPQSAEHLAAIDALAFSHGLLAITRADLADPGPATRQALAEIAATSLGNVETVAVSALTGQGMPDLLDALARLAGELPSADPGAPVRLWVDRAFTIRGSGTVVTGTLPAGTIRLRQELRLTPSMEVARVRGMESLKQPVEAISGVSRVALNVRVPDRVTPARGMALIEPAGWAMTTEIDVRLAAGAGQPDHQPESRRPGLPRAPRELTVHIGSARVIARLRLFDERFGRLALREAMPLHVGDRLLLRDPGAAAAAGPDRGWPAVRGATVLDVNPPPLTRRGAARSAARELATWPPVPAAADLLRRHGLLKASDLRAMGVRDAPQPVFGEWAADAEHWAALRRQLSEVVRAHAANDPLAPGMPLEAARARLGLPARQLVEALAGPPLTVRDGFVRADPAGSGQQAALPARLQDAIRQLHSDLAAKPFAAPDAGRLRDLGLDSKSMAAAARAGLLLRISEQIVLAPGAGMVAAGILGGLPQPFTTAQAREVLGTTRRVAIPLLEYLDRAGVTQRLPDDRRRLNPHRVPATSRPGMTRAQPQ